MMHSRLSALALATLALLAATQAASAQESDMDFRLNRADGYAPLGIVLDQVLEQGQFMVSYRYLVDAKDGLRVDEFDVDFESVLETFDAAPFESTSHTHLFAVQYGIKDGVTLMGRVPILSRSESTADQGLNVFQNTSSGLGDVRGDVLFEAYDRGPYRIHVSGGVSFPTGSIEKSGLVPNGGEDRLGYAMQLGSGSFELHPGLTLQAMNQHGSVGLQVTGSFRLNENSSNYRLGDVVGVSGWFARPISDQFSLSARMDYDTWGSVSGSDPAFDNRVAALSDPSVFNIFTGGSRLDLGLGANVMLVEGPLAGHRFGVEAQFPVSETLDGPQLSGNWGISVGWQKQIAW